MTAVRRRLDLHVVVADRAAQCETTAEACGADNVLVISSTLAGVTLRSVYVGADGATVSHVSHVVLRRRDRLPGVTSEVVPQDELPVTHARGLCLIHHAAKLREVLAELHFNGVRIDVDAAADAIADVYPTAD